MRKLRTNTHIDERLQSVIIVDVVSDLERCELRHCCAEASEEYLMSDVSFVVPAMSMCTLSHTVAASVHQSSAFKALTNTALVKNLKPTKNHVTNIKVKLTTSMA